MRTYSAALFGLLVACPRTSAHTGDGDWTEIPSSQRVIMTAVVDSFMRGMRRADTMAAAQYVANYEVVRAAWTQYLRDSLDFSGKILMRLAASNWISPAADTAAIVIEVPHRGLPTICYHNTTAGDQMTFLLVQQDDRWRIAEFSVPFC